MTNHHTKFEDSRPYRCPVIDLKLSIYGLTDRPTDRHVQSNIPP